MDEILPFNLENESKEKLLQHVMDSKWWGLHFKRNIKQWRKEALSYALIKRILFSTKMEKLRIYHNTS